MLMPAVFILATLMLPKQITNPVLPITFICLIALFLIIRVSFCSQGSEIYTVLAKDGDVGNPNPIHYSIESGKRFTLSTWLL